MPRKESYADETAGTQISISDDFDVEAQARLDELIRQAKVSVETKAKQDFQKLKDDTERKRKDLTIAKRVHMTKTHQEELLQRMKVVVAELQEIAQEEENVIAELLQLTQDDTGKSIFREVAKVLGNAANDTNEVNVGCIEIMENLAKNERTIAAKFLKGRVDLSKLDSGRNNGMDLTGHKAKLTEGDEVEVDIQETQPMPKSLAAKKRKLGKQRR
ncbi:hypothetical protein NliqN6_4898 [Naganishia liquefaciens]|uniref:Uncharacterized protein n=1 Tax=Naganishia liquefaciens TaxID=104408 RepID=A0A8H3YIE2_9TREE|nr:hypothetical protein NliqN6_4898 [Naganishia liquefaciens]